jgi:hypothetical protein
VGALAVATRVTVLAKWRGAMNNLSSFLAATAAIFGSIIALLMLLSRLEPTWRTHKAWVAPDDKKRPDQHHAGEEIC